ncbi:MAG TPA: DEAD/DEAH box helicase, partial [Polyangiaceae bacterium]
MRRALVDAGIDELYSHQALAIDAALRGRHVAIATPTASGKSLCFHVPVLEAMLRDPSATALFVYPTKALSRDQEHGLGALITGAGVGAPATVFDGDTPNDARKAARDRCRIVLTNPDMLHAGILPGHTRWARFFQGLRYVVFDELHTYRGVFGSHLAHVVARLKRLASFHGSQPTFIGATATIGNPREHAARLFGVEPSAVTLVDESGAPRSPREVYVYNPPVVNEELGIRASTLKQSVALAADLVRARVSTIVFGPSRNSVEVMLKYLREEVSGEVPPDAIMGYRGGYLPETRRRVEAGLRNGDVLAVVATNALELGIDIGDLDAVICAGYPGSVAGTWQRFGRAGRRGGRSIAVLVCSSDPLDQFLAREPDYVLGAHAEEARIDPSNTEILIQHLKCAAFEAPFEVGPGGSDIAPDGAGYLGLDGASTRDALDYLARHGLVHEAGGR